MRILILGGDGMLGHRLLHQFSPRHDARVTLRRPLDAYRNLRLFDGENAYGGVEVRELDAVRRVLATFAPDAVINTVGIVKQRADAEDGVLSVEVNAFFPHLLSRLCEAHRARLVHLSTDCVFSGRKGNYVETDRPDPVDVYGFSKLLGEVDRPRTLTLRTSMIGRELRRRTGLLEWFLSQRGRMIKGYRKAIFTGFTTAELARIIERLLTTHSDAVGIYHVASAPISKFDLLSQINRALQLGIDIVPDDEIVCDRSLDGRRFSTAFGYVAPDWDVMLNEIAADIGAVRT